MVTACILIIGNEILSGRTQDANLAFLAQGLNEIGIRLR
ncbi:MAG TPA: competence/damage-inducible protein A, partial [Stellaceae bacterium]|nr:competence/damage-inducible protein A [Stellaceae bacterium]